jgi:Na+-translocating ferredoxin:NAD+ oxidoreductase RnfG subunit
MPTHDDWVRFLAAPVAIFATVSAHATQYMTLEQAQKLIFGPAAQFERRDLKLGKDAARDIEKAAGVHVRVLDVPLWEVSENGKPAGYFIIDEVYGKHEFITYAIALEPGGRVKQIEVLEYRENYGSQIRYPEWKAQFVGKSALDPVTLESDIQNISGATLSCRHVTEGVKRILATYDRVLRKS